MEQEEARAARRVASLLRSHTVTALTGLASHQSPGHSLHIEIQAQVWTYRQTLARSGLHENVPKTNHSLLLLASLSVPLPLDKYLLDSTEVIRLRL